MQMWVTKQPQSQEAPVKEAGPLLAAALHTSPRVLGPAKREARRTQGTAAGDPAAEATAITPFVRE